MPELPINRDLQRLSDIDKSHAIITIGGFAFGNCSKNLVIYGISGSAAETYANKYGITFRLIGSEPSQGNDNTPTELFTATVTLEQDSYVYDGTPKTPAVTVTSGEAVLTPGTDYTVSYSNHINVGTATVTVTAAEGQNRYTGSKTVHFTITSPPDPSGTGGQPGSNEQPGADDQPNTNDQSAPTITCTKTLYKVVYSAKPFKINATSNSSLTFTSSKPKIAAVDRNTGKVTIKNTGTASITIQAGTISKKVTVKVSPKKQSVKSAKAAAGRKLTVKWTKDKMASGYQVQVATDKKFKKNMKSKTLSKTSYTFTKLKTGKKYYVRLRSYKKSGKETLYGPWSNVKSTGKIRK